MNWTQRQVEQIVIDYDNIPAKEQDSNAVETPVENTGDNINQDEVTNEDTADDNESDVPNELDTTTSESDETDTDILE